MADFDWGIGCLSALAGFGILIVLLAIDDALFGGRGQGE